MRVMVIMLQGKLEEVIQVQDPDACRHYLMGLCIPRSVHPEVCELTLEELASWITNAHYLVTNYEVFIQTALEL